MAKKYFNVDVETSGDVSAVDVTASGNMSAVDVTASGDVSAVDVTASGTMSAVDVTASGNMSAVDITASGTVAAASVIATGNVSAVGVTASGDISTTGGDVLVVQGDIEVSNGGIAAMAGSVMALALSATGTGAQITTSGPITAGGLVTAPTFSGAVSGTTVSASVKFDGNVTGNVTGNVNGDLTGNVWGVDTIVRSTTDLILTCDSDNGDTTSEIKFCKNSDNAEVANIDQYGRMYLSGGIDIDTANSESTQKDSSSRGYVDLYKTHVRGWSNTKSGGTSTIKYRLYSDTGDAEFIGDVTANAFNPFTGTHIYVSDTDLSVGSAVELLGSKVASVTTSNSKAVSGIVTTSTLIDETALERLDSLRNEVPLGAYLITVASVGDTRTSSCQGFNVCNEAGDINPGDLLVTSSTPGYLMKQDDDIIRSKTVGKAMEVVTFDDNGQATGIYGYIYCG
jgi:hypothetical protein